MKNLNSLDLLKFQVIRKVIIRNAAPAVIAIPTFCHKVSSGGKHPHNSTVTFQKFVVNYDMISCNGCGII